MATPSKVVYSISGDLDGVTPDSEVLAKQIVVAGLTAPDYINTGADQVVIVFPVTLSPAEKATLDTVVLGQALPDAKTQKCNAIDRRTQELIDEGFVFSGRTYGFSANLTAFDLLRADPGLAYPIDYDSLDNTSVLSLANANELHTFFLAAFNGLRASLDSGTALKTKVRAAATVADVEAIVDPR
jgi:hypothetical protein